MFFPIWRCRAGWNTDTTGDTLPVITFTEDHAVEGAIELHRYSHEGLFTLYLRRTERRKKGELGGSYAASTQSYVEIKKIVAVE